MTGNPVYQGGKKYRKSVAAKAAFVLVDFHHFAPQYALYHCRASKHLRPAWPSVEARP